jgi:hypothetical protein
MDPNVLLTFNSSPSIKNSNASSCIRVISKDGMSWPTHWMKGLGYVIGVSVKLAFIYCFLYHRTRYYLEGSSCGNGEGALPSAGRTQLVTPCGSVVKADGRDAPGHRTGGEQRPDFRSTVIEVGLVEEGESGLRCGETVRCVHGAYCLARGSPVDAAEPAVLV